MQRRCEAPRSGLFLKRCCLWNRALFASEKFCACAGLMSDCVACQVCMRSLLSKHGIHTPACFALSQHMQHAVPCPDLRGLPPRSFIVLDTSQPGSIAPGLAPALAQPRVLAALKPRALADAASHNGPLLAGVSHLAHLPGTQQHHAAPAQGDDCWWVKTA